MANWISSKLKVAETFLQQIDQQAAESLKNNDALRSHELNNETPTKVSEVTPLKDQLKKKRSETNESIGNLGIDHKLHTGSGPERDKEVATSVDSKASSSAKSSNLTDSDWTELLNGPNTAPAPAVNRNNGVSGIRGVRKDGRRKGNLGSSSSLEAKGNRKTQHSVSKTSPKSGTASENELKVGVLGGRSSDAEDSRFLDSMPKTSTPELQIDRKYFDGRTLDIKGESVSLSLEQKDVTNEGTDETLTAYGDGGSLHMLHRPIDAAPLSSEKDLVSEIIPAATNGESDLKTKMHDDPKRFSDIGVADKYNVNPGISLSLKKVSSPTSGSSDSETDSASTSDSESEGEREERRRRRAQILAEKAAAKAIEAIKERENMVARLEGEKQSLEKILEERAKQQAQEASELQTTMMETMDAVDLEKQKHNHTRMEALARLAKVETVNADLARSLATAQWNLEVEVNRVSELRQQIESKEASHEELRWKIANANQTCNNLAASKGFEFEREILEAEYSLVTDKTERLQEKANTLEMNIKKTRNEIENPSEVEIELKRRLNQLTDHLIQKQSQVEALSSEKSTLLFRIEAVSRLLDDKSAMVNANDLPSTSSSREDLESGILELSNAKLRPMLEKRIRSGREHLGSLVRQLDSIFCAGAVFLRRNSTARMWSFGYLVCLHIWVLYILRSHTPVTDETRAGAVISLENLNYTGGVV